VVVKVDNLRLSTRDVKTAGRLIEDRSPIRRPAPGGAEPRPLAPVELKMPAAAFPPAPAVARRYAGRASYGLLTVKERCIGGFGRCGLVMMDGSTGISMSLDGGGAWTDLAGKAGAVTRLTGDVRGHRMTICAAGGEIMAALIPHHCAGGGGRTEVHFYRAHYDAGRWVLGPKVVFERGIRHCADRLALLRDAGGRLWVAWDHLNRLGRYAIHAKFSDDHGRTWQGAGHNGCVGQFRGLPAGPYLARDGRHVACFWRPPDSALHWSRFDGKAWSKPRVMGRPWVPVSAVNVAGTLYVATRRPSQVVRLAGGKWVPDSPPGPGTGLLSRCGQRLVCTWCQPADGGDEVCFSAKVGGGAWSPPRRLAAEAGGIAGLAAPQHAPDGFLPVAYADKARRWIKTTCVRFHSQP